MKVKFTSHRKEYESAKEKAIDRALQTIGGMVESAAKTNLRNNHSVDTGLLRNSITFARGGKGANISGYSADKGGKSGTYSGSAPADSKGVNTVYVGTNVEYAPYVEFGTSRSQAKPYLEPAVMRNAEKYRAVVQKELHEG